MSTIVQQYLENIRSNLKLEASAENEIIDELSTHIEDEIQELRSRGWHEDDAARACIRFLGSAKSTARQIYEAHSQGTWKQALLACLPHILFGLIFLLNWWRGIAPVLIVLIVVLTTSVFDWWHRKSNWLFPWLGFSLLPVIAAGLSLLYLPKALAWIAILLYVPLALWLVLRVVTQTIKKDWVYISLMFLPMPIIVSWFVATGWQSGFSGETLERLYYFGPGIGASFLALALAVISFMRVRKRWVKIAALFLTGMITLSLISFYAWGKLDLIPFLLLIILLGSIFFIPALLANGVRSGKWGKIFEHRPMQNNQTPITKHP